MFRMPTILIAFMSIAILQVLPSLSQAHEPVPMEPVRPEIAPPAGPVFPVDARPFRPEWTYDVQLQNHQGAAASTHQYYHAPEEGRYVREHVVNNPHGEMAHTWERAVTDDGFQYRRSQTWTGPDGTPLRQHEHVVSGADPYNYTREHIMTLPHDRTIHQTHVRSWDGTEGTMERSFVGPNGQTQHFQRSWSPHEQSGDPPTNMNAPMQPSGIAPAAMPPVSEPVESRSWWQKLSPLGNGGRETGQSAAAPAPRRGFTIGTANTGAPGASNSHPGARPAIPASQNAHRPSWAGGVPLAVPQTGPPPHAAGASAAARANAGRGNNR